MLLNAYMLLIVYARVGLTQLYSMLVLFAECWESKLLIQARVEKLNGDLHQPSEIRYVSRSFSVRCLVSLAYRKGLIYVVTLYVVVPQAIGIFLHNTSFINSSQFINWNFITLNHFSPWWSISVATTMDSIETFI